jgi:molybdenum cofactor synthesis domain-containing protein
VLTVDEAVARILTDVPRMPAETVPLHLARGRLLAEPLRSSIDVPSFDNSAMDGYAVRAADTQGATRDAPVCLRLVGTVAAGSVGVPIGPGEAAAVMTGAPLPPGADAVVMVEDTDGAREGRVEIRLASSPGRHRRERGADVRAGALVLAEAMRLTPARLGVAASIGRAALPVRRRPVISVLSTGDELVAPGLPLGPGQIYSSNNAALCALVAEAGGEARDHGTAADDLDATVAALEAAIDGADAVLTTGGVSVGAFDFVKEAHARVGAAVDFWKVRMKPGKPLAFGRVRRAGRDIPLFGLPGNPVSCLVGFAQFARPWIRVALGDPRPFLPVIGAIARDDLRESPGRARLLRVRLTRTAAGIEVHTAGSQSSGVLSALAAADGLLLVGVDDPGPAPGDPCRVQVLDPGFWDGAGPDYGW